METMRFSIDSQGVALLTIDVTDRAMNVLTDGLQNDLAKAINRVKDDPSVVGAVITSGKSNGFVAGADLTDLVNAYGQLTQLEAFTVSRRLSQLFRSIETSGKPFAAAINGSALGGGLELCLACHYRVVADDPKLVVGLPEVNVGLLPGAGGTQRLPRLIGIPQSLELVLSGKSVAPAQAAELGICHAVASQSELLELARSWVLNHPDAKQPWDIKGFQVPGGAGCLAKHAIESFQIGTSRVAKSTARNYPAPPAILAAIFEGTSVPMDTGLAIESKYFARLLIDPVSRNLMRTMFINKGAAQKLSRRPHGVPKRALRKIGVIGAGLMGSGIAHVCAAAGMDVVLIDTTQERAAGGKSHSQALLQKETAKGIRSAEAAAAIAARIVPTTDYRDLTGSDLVIEAVFEDRALKTDVLQGARTATSADAILASNTSSLPITGLAAASGGDGAFIGIHFFSPVERMPLVEIIRGEKTDDRALACALDLVGQLRKVPIVVNDSPGFFTSRVFGAFCDEGMAMLAEGVMPALIENAARMIGMPVGPLAVSDEVSLALHLQVHRQALADGLPPKFQRLMGLPVLKTMVETLGRPGRRGGGGFYEYSADGKKCLWPGLKSHFPVRSEQPGVEELKKRLLFIQCMESARCVEEGVISHAADADLGSIIGIGFPSWTGGTLSYIDTLGIKTFVSASRLLAAQHGDRFKPSPWLEDRAKSDVSFYPATLQRAS